MSIASSIGSKLSWAEPARAMTQDAGNVGAYDLFQRAMWYFQRITKEDNTKAREFFHQAIRLEPRYTRAVGRLAHTHFQDVAYQWTDAPTQSMSELNRMARECIALDANRWICQNRRRHRGSRERDSSQSEGSALGVV